MLFFIHCADKPNHQHIRAAVRPDHLAYLNKFMDRVFIAGPTLSDDFKTMTGSVLIMDLADRRAAADFADDDPYNKAGLFESVSIRPWKKVLPKES